MIPQIAVGSLSLLLLIPLVGAATLLFVPRQERQTLFNLALIGSAAALIWSLRILLIFEGGNGEMQLIERIPWMPNFGINYFVGIDGISLFLVLLTTFLMPIAILASWSIKEKIKE